MFTIYRTVYLPLNCSICFTNACLLLTAVVVKICARNVRNRNPFSSRQRDCMQSPATACSPAASFCMRSPTAGVLPWCEIIHAFYSILSCELHDTTTQCDPYVCFAVLRPGNFYVPFSGPNMQQCGKQPTNSEPRPLYGFESSSHDGTVSSNMLLSGLVMKVLLQVQRNRILCMRGECECHV